MLIFRSRHGECRSDFAAVAFVADAIIETGDGDPRKDLDGTGP